MLLEATTDIYWSLSDLLCYIGSLIMDVPKRV